MLTTNPSLFLWIGFLLFGIFIFWSIQRSAMSTVQADRISHRLFGIFCILILVVGLAVGFIFTT